MVPTACKPKKKSSPRVKGKLANKTEIMAVASRHDQVVKWFSYFVLANAFEAEEKNQGWEKGGILQI